MSWVSTLSLFYRFSIRVKSQWAGSLKSNHNNSNQSNYTPSAINRENNIILNERNWLRCHSHTMEEEIEWRSIGRRNRPVKSEQGSTSSAVISVFSSSPSTHDCGLWFMNERLQKPTRVNFNHRGAHKLASNSRREGKSGKGAFIDRIKQTMRRKTFRSLGHHRKDESEWSLCREKEEEEDLSRPTDRPWLLCMFVV